MTVLDERAPAFLLRRLAQREAEVRRLKRENRNLRDSRDRWREEARNWKWATLSKSRS